MFAGEGCAYAAPRPSSSHGSHVPERRPRAVGATVCRRTRRRSPPLARNIAEAWGRARCRRRKVSPRDGLSPRDLEDMLLAQRRHMRNSSTRCRRRTSSVHSGSVAGLSQMLSSRKISPRKSAGSPLAVSIRATPTWSLHLPQNGARCQTLRGRGQAGRRARRRRRRRSSERPRAAMHTRFGFGRSD